MERSTHLIERGPVTARSEQTTTGASAAYLSEQCDGPTVSGDRYLLMYNPPDDPGGGVAAGWTLIGWCDTSWRWSAALAERGAGAHAAPQVAQATAVRVLIEQGVDVEGWDHSQTTDIPAYWAQLPSPVVPAPRPAPRAPASWAGLRRLWGH